MSSRPSLSRVTRLAMPDIGVCSPWLDPCRMDPGSAQGLLRSVPTVQCDRSQFSMAQIRTGVEGNRHAGCLQLKNDQLVDARPGRGAGHVERPLRSARPVPAQAEAVDPGEALAPARR